MFYTVSYLMILVTTRDSKSWYCFQCVCLSEYAYMYVNKPKSGSGEMSCSVDYCMPVLTSSGAVW